MSDMDTKKALIVIMVLLVIMNVALASYIVVISTGRNINDNTDEYVTDILKQRNIELECKIPEDGPGASSITLGSMIYSDNSIENLTAATGGSYSIDSGGRLIFNDSPADSDEPVEMTRAAVGAFAQEYMASIGLQADDFVLDYIIETGMDEYDVRYLEKDSAGVLYYNSYIEMRVSEYGVVFAEIYIRTITGSSDISVSNLPVQTILLANLIFEPTTKTIDSISFGYYQKDRNSDESVMSWRIHFKDGSERFFEVGNGREITQMTEIPELDNIKFECDLPEVYFFRSPVIYGDSNFTPTNLNSFPVFMNGQAEIDSNGTVNYLRTSFDNTRYDLINDTVIQLSEGFIEDIGLNVREYHLDRLIALDDGSYDAFYVMTDSDGALYFDNFININIKEQGVAYATFRHYVAGVGVNQTSPMAVGTILFDNLDTENGQEYVVIGIDAGYKLESNDSMNAVPCWRIIFEDESVRYFSAENGLELSLAE